jgi:aminoglycoside phosphotransferase (APT) family kinase protein
VIGRSFLVQEFIDGRALTDTLPDSYPDTVDTVNRLGCDLIDQLAVLHSVPTDLPALAKLGRPERFVERQIERWLAVRREHQVRDLPALFALGEWLGAQVPEAGLPAVIHGDYHLDNTLASPYEPEILAIIDWELATVGDPYMDVALDADVLGRIPHSTAARIYGIAVCLAPFWCDQSSGIGWALV